MRLEVTRRSDLAVRALRALAGAGPGERLKGPELARLVEATPGFLGQVMTPLVRAGWVRSDPGPTGGYSLARPLHDVSVLAVVEAVEGPTDAGRCVLADGPCGGHATCALHEPWLRARTLLLAELDASPAIGPVTAPVPGLVEPAIAGPLTAPVPGVVAATTAAPGAGVAGRRARRRRLPDGGRP